MKEETKPVSIYCRTCGREKTDKRMLSTYNEQTGAQEFEIHCPMNGKDCLHGHDMQYRKDLKLFSIHSQPSLKCTRCGALEYSYSDMM